jgi:hypothetical protein
MSPHPETPRARGDDDAPHASPVTPGEDARTIMINRIAWGAVLAGVALSLVAQLILNMLGIGIGLSTLDPATGDKPSAEAFSMGAGLWWTVSGIIAAGIGGFAAGRLAGQPKPASAGWHGLTSWAVATLVVAWLLTSAVGNVLGGAMNAVSRAPAAVVSVDAGEARTTGSLGPEQRRTAEAVDKTADVASTAALVSAIALLLGALAAWFGGRAAAVQPTLTTRGLSSERTPGGVGR